jgi:hypothetical protein
MTQEHRLDRNYFTVLPKDFVIPMFEESRGRRYRNLMPDPQESAPEDGGADGGGAGGAPDPAAGDEADGAPDPAAGDEAGDAPDPAAGDGAGDGVGPERGGADDRVGPGDDGPGPVDGKEERQKKFAAREPLPSEAGTRTRDATRAVERLTSDLAVVGKRLGQFGNGTIVDFAGFHLEVSDLLWKTIERWGRSFPGHKVTLPTVFETGPAADRLLSLVEQLQETENNLRDALANPDKQGYQISVLAFLRSRRARLNRSIRELLENHVDGGDADMNAPEQNILRPTESLIPRVLVTRPAAETLKEIIQECDIVLHDQERIDDSRMEREAELSKKIIKIDQVAGSEIMPQYDNARRYENSRSEIQEESGSMTSCFSSTLDDVLYELHDIMREAPVIVEMENEAWRESRLQSQARRASDLAIEAKLLNASIDEVLEYSTSVINPLFEAVQLVLQDQGSDGSKTEVKNEESSNTSDTNESLHDNFEVSAIMQELEQDQGECNQRHQKKRDFLSKMLRLGTNFDYYTDSYFQELEWEQETRTHLVSTAVRLAHVGRHINDRQVRLNARRAANSSQEAFIRSLGEDVESLTDLARENREFEQRIQTVVRDIMSYKHGAESLQKQLPTMMDETGTTARLRTLLSRPALYKAWVRASLADLGHAQVHAPAGPEHAPGAAAQPAARHPGVAGAAAGAGHV